MPVSDPTSLKAGPRSYLSQNSVQPRATSAYRPQGLLSSEVQGREHISEHYCHSLVPSSVSGIYWSFQKFVMNKLMTNMLLRMTGTVMKVSGKLEDVL